MKDIYGEHTLSVAVSSYNQLSMLKLAFETYRQQTKMPLEVIIADDGSDDGTAEWVQALRPGFDVRWVTHPHAGYGLVQSWNEAIGVARGARVLFTNADILHSPRSFEAHMEATDIGAGLVAGINETGVAQLNIETVVRWGDVMRIRDAHRVAGNLDFAVALNPNFETVGVWSANLSVPLEALQEVGGFSRKFYGKWGCEDYDLVERLAEIDMEVEWVRESMGLHMGHPPADYVVAMAGCEEYCKA